MALRPSAAAGAWIALALLAPTAVFAQPTPPAPRLAADSAPPPRAITLSQALELARKNHPRLAAARLRVVAAARDADVPGAAWLPRVGAFAQVVGASAMNSTTTMLAVGTVDIPRVGGTPITPRDPNWNMYPSTAVAVGVRQQIYDFGRTAAETAAASLVVEIEKTRAAGSELDTDFFVEQAYYAVLAAGAVEVAARAAYERAVAHRDYARANVASGMRPPIEQTRAEADVARYEAGMTRSRGSLQVSRSVLAASVAADDIELDAAGLPPEPGPLPSLADELRLAATTPALREARARVEAQKGETRRLEMQTRPSIYGTAAINGRAGGAPATTGADPVGSGWLPVVPNYDVGVVLAWPLFEPTWDRRADASRQRESAAEADARRMLIEQRSAITTAWQEAEIAASTLTALQRGAVAAEANYDQAEQRFKVGLGTSTELADAQALWTDSDIQLAIGRFQTTRARLVLGRAVAEVPR